MAFLKGWTPRERHAVTASYLGWALDAFDFFVLVFVLPDVAASFGVGVTAVMPRRSYAPFACCW